MGGYIIYVLLLIIHKNIEDKLKKKGDYYSKTATFHPNYITYSELTYAETGIEDNVREKGKSLNFKILNHMLNLFNVFRKDNDTFKFI